MRIFVGSTFEDMKEHRTRVIESLNGLAVHVEAMELWFAMPDEPLLVCLERVSRSDVYICIVAFRYGSETQTGKSYTQCEYEAAKEAGKDCLVFLMADEYPIPPKYVDTSVAGEKLKEFKQTLQKDHLCASFSSPYDLAHKTVESVSALLEAKGVQGAAKLSLDLFWKEMQSKWERLEPSNLRMEFNPQADALSLIEVLANEIDGIEGFHTHIGRSYGLLESDLKTLVERIGADATRLEEIPYYENPLINRDWDWLHLFPNRLTGCLLALDQLRVKYLETLSKTPEWKEELEEVLSKAKKTLEDTLKGAVYID